MLFFLHFLGGSQREWTRVVQALDGRFRCVTIDLPGFGDSADGAGYSVTEMADAVAAVIRRENPRSWHVVGHSMGAKVASVLARRAEEGDSGLEGLAGLVLLAGSPPSPEPIEADRRRLMLSWFEGDKEAARDQASYYIEQNTGAGLGDAARQTALADIARMDTRAWRAWLEHGSREDVSGYVGTLYLPALIVAGSEDKGLGADAQRSLMLPHFARARIEILAGAGHLLPLERPLEITSLIAAHVERCSAAGPFPIDPAYRALIDSDRVSSQTRKSLLDRAEFDSSHYRPVAVIGEFYATLRAVVDRVVPQPQEPPIDLAAFLDRSLARKKGKGWRFNTLPPDIEAWRTALRTLEFEAQALHASSFAALSKVQQDDLLERTAAGELGAGRLRRVSGTLGLGSREGEEARLDARQMQCWFEDLRGDAVCAYVAHPATLSRMGYGGIANGGDRPRKSGFILLEAGERESWEPAAR